MMRDDMKKKVILRCGGMAVLLALGACGGGEGLSRAPAEEKGGIVEGLQISDFANLLQTAPDEFSVITKRPLEMPGSFAALPVPVPGARSSRDLDPLADARAALSFAPVEPGTGVVSASEAALLASVGGADPSIRATLAGEQAAYEARQNVYLLDRIFPSLRELRGDANPDAINAEEERLRLVQAGITTGRAAPGLLPVPASLPPLAASPVQAAPALRTAPLDPGTGPALTGPGLNTTPTFGVLAPEPADTTPSLIYLPE